MGLMKDGASEALSYVLISSPYPRQLALYTVTPTWSTGEGVEVEDSGYARQVVHFETSPLDYDGIIVARTLAVEFGPFAAPVDIAGWAVWGDTNFGGANKMLAAGTFVEDDEPTIISVQPGDILRIAEYDLMIGIAPVEALT